MHEIKPLWCSRRGTEAPIAGVAQFDEPGFRALTRADLDQITGNVAHHMQKERVGFDIEHDKRPDAMNCYFVHRAPRRLALTARCTKARKIPLTDERLRRPVHTFMIEGCRGRTQVSADHEDVVVIEHHVAIAPRVSIEPRMESFRHGGLRPDDGYTVTRERRHPASPTIGASLGVRLETDNLLGGVYPGIGAPRSNDADRFVGDL